MCVCLKDLEFLSSYMTLSLMCRLITYVLESLMLLKSDETKNHYVQTVVFY